MAAAVVVASIVVDGRAAVIAVADAPVVAAASTDISLEGKTHSKLGGEWDSHRRARAEEIS